MNSIWRKLARRRGAIWVLLLPFVLLSSFAPGTMPTWSGGGVEVVLCTGDSLTVVTIGPDGAPVETAHQDCVWGIHMPVSLVAATVAPDAHVTATRSCSARPLATLWHSQVAQAGYTARAPPNLV